MRTRVVLFLASLIFASSAFAIDRWILISGTVSNFHTDARLFNPSFDKDIQVSATFFPTDGAAALTASVTVPKRQQLILNDVTTQLFNTSKLGAIQFTSNDAFEATSRIYAQTAAGTLGQFGPGTAPSLAKQKGVLLQLKQNGVNGQSGTFRTNIGVVNPNNAPANVTWTIYDKNNAVIGTPNKVTYGPMSATSPTVMTAENIANATAGDFSDAWLAYSSDQAIFTYASVIDNGTTDQTFIPAVDDAGVPPAQTPPPPTTQTFNVTLQNFSITVSPDPSTLKRGDTAIFHIRIANGTHVFELVGPSGSVIIPPNGGGDKTFVVNEDGTYSYFCMNSLCGTGHGQMQGSFDVSAAGGGGTGRY
ncbi:MAG TPA: hypothetical protein VLU46_09940 [Thermoanaerobaculia bacterium]|nr:hypothetical protein [Thermoanaerobaculia bacterium]